ncbi:MAG: putative sulfate exporter family transporter [Geobacter sp.]|nr:putative sulfate exporter family transporter [Geobacter sp.]
MTDSQTADQTTHGRHRGARLHQGAFLLLVALCASPWVGTAAALAMGIAFGVILGNPWMQGSAKASRKLLQLSVVGLGFGLGIGQVVHEARQSLLLTIVGIVFTILVGTLIGRLCKNPPRTATLISFGTAICGGSAIAAMAPVIKAENEEIAVSLVTVFTLNSVALLLFPAVGHLLGLSQHDFGVWAGIAIHDTSSVVGAAAAYGPAALAVGTTVKLARALWITPCVIAAGLIKRTGKMPTVPLFILGFIAAALLRSFLPQFCTVWDGLAGVAKHGLVMTLFLIGAGLNRKVLQTVGFRPMVQGVALWMLVSALSLAAIRGGLTG